MTGATCNPKITVIIVVMIVVQMVHLVVLLAGIVAVDASPIAARDDARPLWLGIRCQRLGVSRHWHESASA